MEEIQILKVVRERDIDLLLLEEFHVNQEFLLWFVGQAYKNKFPVLELINACHSVMDSELGESDLVVQFSNNRNEKYALLIENKIDAIPQPSQAKRYTTRGSKGKEEGSWKDFKTCIVAPEKYLQNNGTEASIYDTKISYEEIAEWLKRNPMDPIRSEYRAEIVKNAIEQNRNGYNPTPHESVTELFLQYWEFCSDSYPELGMPRPREIPANSDFIYFKPSGIPKEIKVVHKMEKGFLDLQISRGAEQIQRIEQASKNLISSDMRIVPAGKSAAIRLMVPIVDRFGKFEEQMDSIKECLTQAIRLVAIGKKINL
jgi:hypothetical protein